MRLARAALVLSLAVGLPGCLHTSVLIRVGGDGSGTIVLTNLKKAWVPTDFFLESDEPPTPLDDGVPEKANEYGKGVKFQSVKIIETEEWKGYIATYTFQDVTKLFFDRLTDQDGDSDTPSTEYQIRFAQLPDGRSQLAIRYDRGFLASAGSESGSSSSTMPEEAGRALLSGLRIYCGLEVEGKLLYTDYPYREGNRITLFELDFDKILAFQERMNAEIEELVRAPEPETLPEARAQVAKMKKWLLLSQALSNDGNKLTDHDVFERLNGIDGIRMPLEDEIHIEFRADSEDD